MRSVSASLHRLAILGAIAIDLAAVALGFCLPSLLRFTPDALAAAAWRVSGLLLIAMGAVLWLAVLSSRAAYAPRVMVGVSSQVLRVMGAAIPAWVLTHLLAFLVKAEVPLESRLVMGVSLPAVIVCLIVGRLALVRPLARRAYPRLARGPILVLGDTERAGRLAREIRERDGRGRGVIHRPLASTTPQEAARLVEDYGFGEVVIEPDGQGVDEVFDTAFACLDARSEVKVVSHRFEVVNGRAAIGEVNGIPVMRFRRLELAGPEIAVKRVVDVLGAGLGLIALSPLFLAIAIAVKLSSPGPILFRQERVGRRGRHFLMYKFRTMLIGNDPHVHREYFKTFIRDGAPAAVNQDGAKIYKMIEDPRVTRVGALLRSLSLDELPQLYNVLRGDMSLVGPRPCLPYEWDLYRPWQRRRLDVFPGCTGLWQVTARSHVSFEEMVILDLHYAHHGTVGRDLWLIAQTIPAMIRGQGGY